MKCYRIKAWNDVFEDRRTRDVQRLTHVFLPITEDGEGFRFLMQTTEGISAYGVFIALVRIAGRCPGRGVLADERGPLTTDRMAIRTGMPKQVVADAVRVLESPDVGWLEAFELDAAPVAPSRGGAPVRAVAPPPARRPRADESPPLQQCNGHCSLPENQGSGQAVRSENPRPREDAARPDVAPQTPPAEAPLPAAALPNSQAAQGIAHCRKDQRNDPRYSRHDPRKDQPPKAQRVERPTSGKPAVQDLASRLVAFSWKGSTIYDQGAASAMAKQLFADRSINPHAQLSWAIETMHARSRTEVIENPGGYFRHLLLKERAPPEWIHEHQRQSAENLLND